MKPCVTAFVCAMFVSCSSGAGLLVPSDVSALEKRIASAGQETARALADYVAALDTLDDAQKRRIVFDKFNTYSPAKQREIVKGILTPENFNAQRADLLLSQKPAFLGTHEGFEYVCTLIERSKKIPYVKIVGMYYDQYAAFDAGRLTGLLRLLTGYDFGDNKAGWIELFARIENKSRETVLASRLAGIGDELARLESVRAGLAEENKTYAARIEKLEQTRTALLDYARRYLDRADFADLARALLDPGPEIRLYALKKINDSTVKLSDKIGLIRARLDDPDNGVLEETIRILGQSRDTEAVVKISQIAVKPGPLRKIAVTALGEIGDTGAENVLAGILQEEMIARDILTEAIRANARLKTPASAVRIAPFLINPDEDIRKEAIIALGVLASDKAIPALENSLRNETSEVNRSLIIDALGRIGDAGVIEILKEYVTHSERQIREALAQALGAIKSPDAVPVLTQLLVDPEERVQLAALAAIENCSALREREISAVIRAYSQENTELNSAIEKFVREQLLQNIRSDWFIGLDAWQSPTGARLFVNLYENTFKTVLDRKLLADDGLSAFRLSYLEALINAGNLEKAEIAAKQMPYSPTIQMKLAKILFAAEKLDEAMAILKSIDKKIVAARWFAKLIEVEKHIRNDNVREAGDVLKLTLDVYPDLLRSEEFLKIVDSIRARLNK